MYKSFSYYLSAYSTAMLLILSVSVSAYALRLDKIRNDSFSFNASELIHGANIQNIDLGVTSKNINNNIVELDTEIGNLPTKDIKKTSRRNVFRATFNRNELPCDAAVDVTVKVQDTFGNSGRLSNPSNANNYIGVTYTPYEFRRRCYSRDRGLRRIIYRFNLSINDLAKAGNSARFKGSARINITYP